MKRLLQIRKSDMQIKQIKVDHWYQTKQGVGKCLNVSAKSAKFELPSEVVWLTPKEVEYEIPRGDEPHADEELPATTLDVFIVVKKHVDELADAWRRGAIQETDGQGGMRSNRNSDVQRLLEKVIAKEKGGK